MTVGPLGDLDNVSAADCAVRMANAGASVVGTNCYYDPATTLETLALMKEGLAKAGLLDKPTYLMAQPLGFNCPDAANTKFGYVPCDYERLNSGNGIILYAVREMSF